MNKVDNYKPTKAEERLLEVLLNPENRQKSVVEICKLADMSREIYYRSFRKPEFLKLYKEMSYDLVKQSVIPILNAVIKEAKDGSYNHAKLVLEMANMYNNNLKIEINTDKLTDEEISELLGE